MANYRVGERLVLAGLEDDNVDAKYNGMEVVVSKPLGFNPAFPNCYEVVFIDTYEIKHCAHLYLKRPEPKRGDLDTVVSWESVGWKPNKEEDK